MKDKDKEKSRRFKHLLTLTKSSNVLYVSEKSKMQFFAHLVPNLAAKIAWENGLPSKDNNALIVDLLCKFINWLIVDLLRRLLSILIL